MAYNYSSFINIIKILQKLKIELGPEKIRVLSVGYPDFIIPNCLIKSSTYSDILKSAILDEQDHVTRWHKINNKKYVAVSLFEVLSKLFNLDLYYCDIQEGTGSIDYSSIFIKLDLNLQCKDHLGFFDLILDSGTSEHCFNIGQVFNNYHNLISSGGYLYQWSPFLSPNHGFYSINPTLYHDLDRISAFKIHFLNLFGFNTYKAYFRCKPKTIRFRSSLKFRIWPWEFSFIILNEVLLQKTSETFEYPVQSKYLDKSFEVTSL